jgi:2-keto-4-pentenoate hydratase/2-oxohepta-3-ene-1,7-dioic acid hydratase in catechol pathway
MPSLGPESVDENNDFSILVHGQRTGTAMKIVRFSDGVDCSFGVVEGQLVRVLRDDPLHFEILFTGEVIALSEVRVLSPVARPTKVICVGMNYEEHRKDLSYEGPPRPLIFLKPSSSVIGPTEPILIPNVRGRVVHEGELAIVIGKKATRVHEKDYKEYVFGYTIANDVSARDQMFEDGQWARSKGYDTFCPVGPYLETDLNFGNLEIETFVDGQPRRRGNTSEMIYKVPALIEFISDAFTLFPGDIILTGTPSGLGRFFPGQTIDIRIESLGILSNPSVSRG